MRVFKAKGSINAIVPCLKEIRGVTPPHLFFKTYYYYLIF